MTNPHPPGTDAFAERNREILAERSHWPDGALDTVRFIESKYAGWHVWWTDRPWRRDGKVPDGTCFGAAPTGRGLVDSIYATDPADLAEAIELADAARRRDYPWLYR